jgi:hypothetical protein
MREDDHRQSSLSNGRYGCITGIIEAYASRLRRVGTENSLATSRGAGMDRAWHAEYHSDTLRCLLVI